MASTLPGETGHLSDVLADASLQILAKLFKNAINPDAAALTIASFTEANFAGYAAVPVGGWGMCESEVDEVGEAVSDPVEFRAGAGVTPQVVYGMYVISKHGAGEWKLIDFCMFTTPITVDKEGQTIPMQVRATSVNFPEDA